MPPSTTATANKRPPVKPTRSSHRSTLSLQKTEITIHVYDLLPPGKLSNTLWYFGTSLLHSGVVLNNKEYAYGGHDRPGLTGVYWTKPLTLPPGGTFRTEILHGFTLATEAEVDSIIRKASEEFLGTSYNLLTKNCNHFTSYLCERLTGRPGPGWLNRAASIGVALPCVVPREWIEAPDFETHGNSSGGGLLEGEESGEDEYGEGSRMLRGSDEVPRLVGQEGQRGGMRWGERGEEMGNKGKGKARDEEGRVLPRAERAPTS
ncbi:PPPDE putative peptidase domain-containing protein [Triangularia setosa]|uniref:PPPDE putative peptidase domain-containing protein n=1 Tax=Triangularia setosa TaxID=2587417 RepID=A0AAN6W3G1_9PEZI|nr:PPPDE putative peptidase domain-containing protein [Podospora setosa]